MKKVIMHGTMARILVTARYLHLWHECIAMMNRKFIVRLKTETEHLCKRGDIVQYSLWTRVLYHYNRLNLGIESISFNVQRTWKLSIRDEKNVVINENSVEGKKTMYR